MPSWPRPCSRAALVSTAAVATPTHTPRPGVRSPRRRRSRAGLLALALTLLAVAAGAAALALRSRAAPTPRYLTRRLSRGSVVESIRATGTVQPVLQVQVGAQVSGRVLRVAVDFNSRVRRGDLLAELDPTQYQTQVTLARAALLSTRAVLAQNRANLSLASRNLARARLLRAQSLVAQVDLDSALAAYDAARATVGVAQAGIAQAGATLDSARTNLTYTRILAPIDGTVATRSVDPGQTVAASFQTPTLFLLANDLTHMQVLANVDEADIGKLREGMDAVARVDAFPLQSFRGTVNMLRINPTTTNGVVSYTTVIDVDNPRGELRPGMTATVTVSTARREGVLRVPNAALRYRPAGAPEPEDTPDARLRGAVYLPRAGGAVRVPVTVGLSDGVATEVSGPGLAPGDEVVIDETDAAGGASAGGASAGGARPGARMRVF